MDLCCLICDRVHADPIKLDCECQFCFHCLLSWFRWVLMKASLVCPLCNERVEHMAIKSRTLTPVESRLLVWAYSFMYTYSRWCPRPKQMIVAKILYKISCSNTTQGAANGDEREWMKAEMGVDGEEAMFGMVKDFVETNYWWMWEFSMNRLI